VSSDPTYFAITSIQAMCVMQRRKLTNREKNYVQENDVDVRQVVADTLRERRGGDVEMA
jgi:hypothetical protein